MALGSDIPEVGESKEGQGDATARFVNKFIARNKSAVRAWQTEAIVAEKVAMGQLWDEADAAKLREENRPTPQINFAKKYIDVTSGIEMLNRLEVNFLARVVDSNQSQRLSEEVTGIYATIMDNCKGYYDNSRVFRNQLITGMGWAGERMDLTREASGEALVEWINNMEMIWDTNAQKDNLEDGRMLVRMRVTPKYAAIEEWPDHKEDIEKWAHTGELSPLDDPEKDRHVVPQKYDPLNALDKQSSIPKDFVTIKEAYWYEIETWHEFIDPFTHQAKELPTDKFNEVKKAFQEMYPDTKMVSYKSRRRVYKRAFVIGGCTLEEGDSPMEDHFPYQCCTGDWDADQKVWRGLLWTLMEPEKYATKMFSIGLHIMATSQKGGLFFEPDVFVNQKQAEEEWGRPDPFIPVTDGAIANKKFEVRDPQQPPDGIFRIWTSCVEMIQQVTGINVDVLGSSTGEVPVGTTKRRQMQGVAAIAGYFNSYRRFMLNQAEALFEYIAKFYTDDRAVRIGGPYDGQVIQLAKDDVECHYDLKIDLSPMNADQKAAAWEAMEPILPVLVKTGGIFAVPSIMDYAPLPAKLSMEIKQYLQGMAKAQQAGAGQHDDKGKGKQMPPELIKANVDLKAQQARLTASKAAAIDQESALERARAQMEQFTTIGEHRRSEQQHRMNILGAQQDIAHKNRDQKIAELESYSKMLGNLGNNQPEVQA